MLWSGLQGAEDHFLCYPVGGLRVSAELDGHLLFSPSICFLTSVRKHLAHTVSSYYMPPTAGDRNVGVLSTVLEPSTAPITERLAIKAHRNGGEERTLIRLK